MSAASSANPYIAITLQWIGGLGSASFYLPFLRVRRWSWETYWLVGGFFSWIVAPIVFAMIFIPELIKVFEQVSGQAIFWTYFFGVLWGFGSVTFGLTLRYLGIGLGMAVALSYTAAFGTLIPPIINGTFGSLFSHAWGLVTLLGITVCLAGIGLSGAAGWAKEHELQADRRKAVVKEYNFFLGMLVATFSGIMSACINLGFAGLNGFNAVHGQNTITTASAVILLRHGHGTACEGLPTLIVVLAGGFTTNVVWCTILHIKNGTGREYIVKAVHSPVEESGPKNAAALADTAVTGEHPAAEGQSVRNISVPLLNNYTFAALAGVIWYLQFFFYTAGQSFMPAALAFSGWTLHMASVIIFATLWGIVRHEWRGTSKKTHAIITCGVGSLVIATLIVGAGNLLKSRAASHLTTPPVKSALTTHP